MLIYVCSSSHGFGHAARDVAVLQALHQLRPDWQLVLSSQLNERVLMSLIGEAPIQIRPCRWDVGMVQADALGSDPDSTLLALEHLHQQLPDLVRAEAEWIRSCGRPALVLGDIPPAAAALAARLDAPLVWMSNFGWDDIYAPFGGAFLRHAEQARASYATGQLLLRCPFDLAMDWGCPEQQLGLVCGTARSLPPDLMEALTTLDQPLIQIGFGGLGLPLDGALLERWTSCHFVMAAPHALVGDRCPANLTLLPEGVRPLDVFPFCARHLGKPGFSTFAEAMAAGVGLHVVERRDFAEVRALLDGLVRHSHHRQLSREQLMQGDWELDRPLLPPSESPLDARGARSAAEALVMQLE
ncbi:hypothetical protein [Parasynechococcus sp.]|uniref:hypothetical protein n=1 Tax=Parasynechococcus sp. TaxID=3101203 RepID=UPI0037040F18